MSCPSDLPEDLVAVSDEERNSHRELVLRNVDFLTELLIADHELSNWIPATGCPYSTPEAVARNRGDKGTFPCQYSNIERYDSVTQDHRYDSACVCGDPLTGSDDPLDAVAAVCLGTGNRTIAERYTDRQWRSVIARLRDKVGSWEEISHLTKGDLASELEDAKEGSIANKRCRRLTKLLETIKEDDRFESVSLIDLPTRSYSSFQSLLSNLPGISDRDAWWLLLTAFDKPVFPADPEIDRLLCDLGLITPEEIGSHDRHEDLVENLVDRQIPSFHRALAGHAARESGHFGSEGDELRKFSLTFRSREQRQLCNNEDLPVAVDLFSGAGGISHGLLEAGYDIGLAVDHDRNATDSYRLNHPQIPHTRIKCADIDDLLEHPDWQDMIPESPDIIVGGPPCQSLSVAGYRSRRADDSNYSIRDDPRTTLYSRYLQVVHELEPEAIVLENVEGMASEIEDTDFRVVDQIMEDLEANGPGDGVGYAVDFQSVDCSKYGIPQTRDRIIVFGVREDLAREGITPDIFFETLASRGGDGEEAYTLKQGLAGLPRISWDEGGNIVTGRPRGKSSEYVNKYDLKAGTNLTFNHLAREHPMEKDRKLFELMDPGDTGWFMKYKKDGGKWSHLVEYEVGTEENPAFTDKYRMVHWDEPAPTVVAHLAKDSNNYILPDYYKYANPRPEKADRSRNRGVTPREAARLQSFPDDYIFLGPFTSQFRQIGNAVPPVLALQIGKILEEVGLPVSDDGVRPDASTGKKPASADD